MHYTFTTLTGGTNLLLVNYTTLVNKQSVSGSVWYVHVSIIFFYYKINSVFPQHITQVQCPGVNFVLLFYCTFSTPIVLCCCPLPEPGRIKCSSSFGQCVVQSVCVCVCVCVKLFATHRNVSSP